MERPNTYNELRSYINHINSLSDYMETMNYLSTLDTLSTAQFYFLLVLLDERADYLMFHEELEKRKELLENDDSLDYTDLMDRF